MLTPNANLQQNVHSWLHTGAASFCSQIKKNKQKKKKQIYIGFQENWGEAHRNSSLDFNKKKKADIAQALCTILLNVWIMFT